MLSVVLDSSARMWHVTLTVEGAAVSSHEIRAALERLSEEHPFLLAGRYASNRAEVRYWTRPRTPRVQSNSLRDCGQSTG